MSESQGPSSPCCALIVTWASLGALAPTPEGVRGTRRGSLCPLGPPFLTSGDRPHPAAPSGDSRSFPRQPNDSCLPERGYERGGQASHAASAAEAQDPDEGLPQPGRERTLMPHLVPHPLHAHVRPQHLSPEVASPAPFHGPSLVWGLNCVGG